MAHILLGVSGSIAAYKVPFIIRALQKAHHTVSVVLTRAAQEFVTPLTLQTLARGKVITDLWGTDGRGDQPGEWTQHIALAKQADVFLIAPATAHTIAKLAQGLCDDLLSAIFLATRKPVLIAPAMEGHMYRHPTVQQNLQRLRRLPWVTIIEPGYGFLASGERDVGRLASLKRILLAVERALNPPLLKGKKVLITLGATREPWDAVRFLSNRSTGRMGLALAEAAYTLGADKVHLLAAHTEVAFPKGLFEITYALTAKEMLESFQSIYQQYDWLIFAAAVSDYTFSETLRAKYKKSSEPLTLTLIPAPDILAWAGQHRLPHQRLIGFALEAVGEEAVAYEKLHRKGADWLAFNEISPSTGMESPTNALTLLSRWGHRQVIPLAPKPHVAKEMLKFIAYETPATS
ncbi:MAG: bifunctional phosphopantothenoylcysteine decarboxylase/phosphopantothenate--cysteine ligase CoaBC [Bacteroidia bacterium]|nr:bifunctional phosphopantothenoylcysteine decarboxylase/phosphopantothenate--cysteine ligase CoaBC [Bacteroidia bacterium]MCX7764466.1 bifunctional phosphopantothenoylcysteine decarboxylase/phosphopantothenate--cysteine ligase CoaBC [Bacteroidia bacterium]MDW8057052.1 bifunctional phosphopantothenoylcysteine decarboxylase/phosphopantothenate--cysteine ligase CoaBC [Bacteroidia bacterium]